MFETGVTPAVLTGIFYFFTYAFLGWVAEVAYAACATGNLVNRGFLNGPICPIYGFGMLALLALMDRVGQSLAVQFLAGMAVATGIELVGGWALARIFHTRWWDYSMYRFNLGGYICLRFSLLWGVGSLVMVRLVHPFVAQLAGLGLRALPEALLGALAGALGALFVADIALSAAAAVGLGRYLRQIDTLRANMRTLSDRLTSVIGGNALELDEVLDESRLQLRLAAMEGRDNAAGLREQLNALAGNAAAVRASLAVVGSRHLGGARRLLRAFPDMRSDRAEALAALRRYTARMAGAAREKLHR